MPKRKVSAKAVVTDIRSGLSDVELTEKYGLSPAELKVVFNKLVANKILSAEEISHRTKRRSKPVNTEKSAIGSPQQPQQPEIDPQLAETALGLVRKGSHDNELMMALSLSPGQLQDLLSRLVQLGYLSAEELEARKPRKTKTCPHCSNQISESDTRCQHCGKDPAQPPAPTDAPPPLPESVLVAKYDDSERAYCVWEDRGNQGIFRAYTQTAIKCLVNPSHFFSELPLDAGYWSPIRFLSLSMFVTAFFASLWVQIASGVVSLFDLVSFTFVFKATLTVIPLVLTVLVWSLLIHGMLKLMKGAETGFQATFRVVSYSSVTGVFGAIPVLGTIASLWGVYLTIVGLREVNEIKTSKASAAVLIPSSALALVLIVIGIGEGISDIRVRRQAAQGSVVEAGPASSKQVVSSISVEEVCAKFVDPPSDYAAHQVREEEWEADYGGRMVQWEGRVKTVQKPGAFGTIPHAIIQVGDNDKVEVYLLAPYMGEKPRPTELIRWARLAPGKQITFRGELTHPPTILPSDSQDSVVQIYLKDGVIVK